MLTIYSLFIKFILLSIEESCQSGFSIGRLVCLFYCNVSSFVKTICRIAKVACSFHQLFMFCWCNNAFKPILPQLPLPSTRQQIPTSFNQKNASVSASVSLPTGVINNSRVSAGEHSAIFRVLTGLLSLSVLTPRIPS